MDSLIFVRKPQLIFFFSIPVIMLFGILTDEVWMFNWYDTYYVIAYFYVAIFNSCVLGIYGFGYWMLQITKQNLSTRLIWLHIGLTYGGALLAWILSQLYRPEIMEFEFNDNLSVTIWVIVLLIIAGQILFPVQIVQVLLANNAKKN